MSEFPFPGEPDVVDGSGAVVWVETQASSAAAAYPITPSTAIGVGFQQAVANGKKNVWDETLVFFEAESEHSSASVCEGYALAGGRISNFTSGQGLILMKEVLYVIAGKRLPVVFHIGARTLSVHSLNVHAGHDDVMGVADCGWGMLFACNAQEAADFALIARKTAEDSFTPFFNIQDGFLTTHVVEKVSLPNSEFIKTYLKSPDHLTNFVDPKKPIMTGTVQNQEVYMKGKVAQRAFYEPIKENLIKNMETFYQLTGRQYSLINTYYMEDAEYAIIGMGSFMETAKATVDTLREKFNEKVGVVTVHAFRPFPGPELVAALKNVKVISVLERLDESSAPENPLARELKAAFSDAHWGHPVFEKINRIPVIQHGSAGLGGLDVRVRDFQAIIENMKKAEKGKIRYCVGISHPDALLLESDELDTRSKDYFSMRGYSVSGLGSMTTNKIIASVCAELFNKDVQAYPKYGAEKQGLPTMFFLAIDDDHIKMHQELKRVNFVAIQDIYAFHRENPLSDVDDGGIVYLQFPHAEPDVIWKKFPKEIQETIKEKKLKLYALDATHIAREVAPSPDLVLRIQGIVLLGVFLKVTPFMKAHQMTETDVFDAVEKILNRYFGAKSKRIVENSLTCVKRGFQEVREIPYA